jgi:hypothetical protein
MGRFAGLIGLACLLTGCATPYGPMDFAGGYEEARQAENEYTITFLANGFTRSKQAQDFALLRAAEIAAKLHFTHFVIKGTKDVGATDVVSEETSSSTNGFIYGNSYNSSTTASTSEVSAYKPGVILDVLYFDGPPVGRYLEVYEAQETLIRLRAQYRVR